MERLLIFLAGFICGLFLWLYTGIQNWLSILQIRKMREEADKSLADCGKYVIKDKMEEVILNETRVGKIEKFLNDKWIPTYIDNYNNNFQEIYKNNKDKEEFIYDNDGTPYPRFELKEILKIFIDEINKKRIELLKGGL